MVSHRGNMPSKYTNMGISPRVVQGESRVGEIVSRLSPPPIPVSASFPSPLPSPPFPISASLPSSPPFSPLLHSCGDVYSTPNSTMAGYMATVAADRKGRATFQVVSEQLKVWDVIGRSMVVHGCTPSSSQLENR